MCQSLSSRVEPVLSLLQDAICDQTAMHSQPSQRTHLRWEEEEKKVDERKLLWLDGACGVSGALPGPVPAYCKVTSGRKVVNEVEMNTGRSQPAAVRDARRSGLVVEQGP